MSTYNLRRFAQPDALKTIRQDNLIGFLKEYEIYLNSRGFTFELDEDGHINFDRLSEILMNPTENMDVSLVDALFLIQEMANEDQYQELCDLAEQNDIQMPEDGECSPADLALALWIKDPELLKRPHAEVMVLKPKSFLYFQSEKDAPKNFTVPKAEILRAMEQEMDRWFTKNKKGTGCRIMPVAADDENKVYFLIRHGMPFKREGKMDSGKSTIIFYRPEFHDVLIYDRLNNELAVFNKSQTQKERRMYLSVFSEYLFNEAEYFPGEEKYTLAPLTLIGAEALACLDVPGMVSAKLVEIQVQYRGPLNDRNTYRSNDLFASMAAGGRTMPNLKFLVSASFAIKFENSKRPRTVKIRTPNIANYDRKEDSHLVEMWLRNREFVKKKKSETDKNIPVQEVEREDASIAAMA